MNLPFVRYIVSGDSMEPAFIPGDRVLVNRRCTLQPQDVIVFRHNGRKNLKRIVAITPRGFHVVGDNTQESTDSRAYGPITRSQILGKVVMKY